MAYATVSDLIANLPDGLDVPPDATRLLDRASEAVAEVLMRAYYATDSTGRASDPAVVAAIVRAECLQAAYWVETGDEQGAAVAVTSASSGAGPSWGGSVQTLAARALTVLRTATDSTGYPLLSGPWSR